MIKGKISTVYKKAEDSTLELDENVEQDSKALQLKEFDWDEFEKISKPGLNENLSIKTKPGETVYSHEIYAQDAYHIYSENTENMTFNIPQNGEVFNAKVVSIDDTTAILDIKYREYAYLELRKEEKRYLPDIKKDVELKVKIINDRDGNNVLMASYSDANKLMKQEEIKNSINTQCAFTADVKELISGGFIVKIDGIECFMPGSQVTMNKISNFEDYIGKKLIVMPINFSPEKNTIVVSARTYLQTLMPIAIEYIKDNSKKKYTGTVTGTTKFGVFCEFSTGPNEPKCLTGLIHISDLDKKYYNKHHGRNIDSGDQIEFFVKEVVQNNKIILTQTPENNPWDNIEEKYKIQSTVIGKVLSIKEYGAFVELEKGLSGLLHFSEYDGVQLDEGDKIKVKIIRIEKSSKKITFSAAK
jgi:small subunit ribosomal protein S1